MTNPIIVALDLASASEARDLSARTGAIVEPDLYDLGYWGCVARDPRPTRAGLRQEGWDEANREIEHEAVRRAAEEHWVLVNEPTRASWHMTTALFELLSERGQTVILSADDLACRYRAAERKGVYERVYLTDSDLVTLPEGEHA